MVDCRVRLIASVPGAHTGGEMNKWGHLKLRKVCISFSLYFHLHTTFFLLKVNSHTASISFS